MSAVAAGEKRIKVRAFDGLSLSLSFHRASPAGYMWGAVLQGSQNRIHVIATADASNRPRFVEADPEEQFGPADTVRLANCCFELPAESFAAARAWFEGLQLPERGQ